MSTMTTEPRGPARALLLNGAARRVAARLCDVLLVLVVLAGADRADSELDLVVGGLMALCLLLRRRRPGGVLAAVLALGAAQFALHGLSDTQPTTVPAPYDVAVLFAMMSVVHHSRAAWMPYAAGVTVLTASALGATGVPGTGMEPFLHSWQDLTLLWGMTIAVWLLAYSLQARRLYAESQAARARQAERERAHLVRIATAEERAEIARELHDVVAHSLAVMTLQADGAGYVLRTSPDAAAAALKVIAATGRDAIDDMHRIVRVLRHGDGGGPDTAPRRKAVTLGEIHTAVARARAAGLSVDLSIETGEERLTAAEQVTAFRIVQESLTNVLRHAGTGAKADVRLWEERDVLLVTVVDDGGGRLSHDGDARVARRGGNGLVGMRERAELAGGGLEAGPRLGPGWRVCARIPRRMDDDAGERNDPGGRG
ncbi:sensor histidine kinase [Streptomyces coelicoflavus]|uniref:sensor histidine kinase n=1 Tax=Streptomyces coelicoflavus TaxID=285562 RepID=UPI003F4A2AA6